jgi:hypothetical protein
MNIERNASDLILEVADGELQNDPTLLDRAADLSLAISDVYCLRVVISPKEFASCRTLFGTRFSKPPGKNWSIVIRREIPNLDTPRPRTRVARPRPKKIIAARVPRRRKVKA